MAVATAFANLVKTAVASTGTGTITLGSAITGFRGASVLTNGATYGYTILHPAGAYENGHGTYTSSGTTLTRGVDDSSNSNAAITLDGTETIIIGHILALDALSMAPNVGSVVISPAGAFAKEQSVSDARALTTSKIICSVSGAMNGSDPDSFPDELEFDNVQAYGRCAVNGTVLIRLVGRDKMHASYVVNYVLY